MGLCNCGKRSSRPNRFLYILRPGLSDFRVDLRNPHAEIFPKIAHFS